ncbi:MULTISPECIES: bidirectional hydrogenase complex protein HoxE [Calditerrivibrio]|uniref:bidirectional hydrogenase complex protein HoxE n=1 Tax=Calditerrivibrio TaxID=545865 RepID=UPI003C73A0CA
MFGKPKLPSEDKRWKIIQNTMKKNGYNPDSLIEVLHTVQEYFGFIDEDALKFVSESLNIPYSRAYSVVTFYHYFTLKPKGEHICVVCTGTACYIKGANNLLAHLKNHHDLSDGDTTNDGKVSLLTARCVGACSLAPVVVVDNKILGEVNSEKLDEVIKRCRDAV